MCFCTAMRCAALHCTAFAAMRPADAPAPPPMPPEPACCCRAAVYASLRCCATRGTPALRGPLLACLPFPCVPFPSLVVERASCPVLYYRLVHLLLSLSSACRLRMALVSCAWRAAMACRRVLLALALLGSFAFPHCLPRLRRPRALRCVAGRRRRVAVMEAVATAVSEPGR